MRMIFCNDELEPQTVDSCFHGEAEAARQCGLSFELVDFNAARTGNAEQM